MGLTPAFKGAEGTIRGARERLGYGGKKGERQSGINSVGSARKNKRVREKAEREKKIRRPEDWGARERPGLFYYTGARFRSSRKLKGEKEDAGGGSLQETNQVSIQGGGKGLKCLDYF